MSCFCGKSHETIDHDQAVLDSYRAANEALQSQLSQVQGENEKLKLDKKYLDTELKRVFKPGGMGEAIAERDSLKADLAHTIEEVDSMRLSSNALKAENEKLRECLRWMRQTVHQAHHDGPIEGCRKNTCDAVTQALQPRSGE